MSKFIIYTYFVAQYEEKQKEENLKSQKVSK